MEARREKERRTHPGVRYRHRIAPGRNTLSLPGGRVSPAGAPAAAGRGRDLLNTAHGTLRFPSFLPDATLGAVRAVDGTDLVGCGIEAVVMNVYHLMQRPGSSTVKALGGLHQMAAWSRPIITDSGGFQAYSLITENPKYGRIADDGIIFQPDGADRKFQLTPEKSIQLQHSFGADVLICLDQCTHPDAPLATQEESVRRTIAWARRCKDEYNRLVSGRKAREGARPLLFGVIQGGASRELRRRCAEELLAIGFDGYGYGGWPLDGERKLMTEIIGYTRELVPREYPMHALGVGHPLHIATCWGLGYGIFDSALPTRDARHGRLYVLRLPPAWARRMGLGSGWFDALYINDAKHIKANVPLDPACDCLCCANYSLGYLHHLFKTNESLYYRLATVHNLRAMTRLTDHLRGESDG
jgi:queuine tRNA-ribosyltransferase